MQALLYSDTVPNLMTFDVAKRIGLNIYMTSKRMIVVDRFSSAWRGVANHVPVSFD